MLLETEADVGPDVWHDQNNAMPQPGYMHHFQKQMRMTGEDNHLGEHFDWKLANQGKEAGSHGMFLLHNMDLHLDIRNMGGYLHFHLLAFDLESVPMICHLLLDEDYSVVQIVHYELKSSNFLLRAPCRKPLISPPSTQFAPLAWPLWFVPVSVGVRTS